MDENIPRQISIGLRLRGVEVLTVQEDQRDGQSDPEIFARATELNRILFSRDNDMLVIARTKQRDGTAFPGLVYVHPNRITLGDCVRDLEVIAKASTAEDCRDQVQYLPL